MEEIQKCEILKTHIAVVNMRQTVSYIEENMDVARGKYICIANVHTTVMAFENEQYRDIQNNALLALPDGKPLSVVSKKMGYPETERVAGPDLMEELFRVSEKRGYRHYFYGSTEKVLEKLRIMIQMKYPALSIVGMEAPPFRELSEDEDIECINRINDAKPDIVWVGLGAPKQEIWMYHHSGKIKALMLGVGAGFDFHAGVLKRAPKWMQNIGLEWLYRLCQEPGRLWKRYFKTNWKFISLVRKQMKL